MRYPIWFVIILWLITGCTALSGDDPTPAPSPTPTSAPVPAPNFTLNNIDGQPVTLSDLQGQWVLLNFWATWCKPCVAEMPVLQAVSENRDDLRVLGINVREPAEEVRPFLADNGITYTILLTPRSPEADAVLASYQAMSLPQSVLIAPDGSIVWRQFGELELDSFSQTLAQTIEAWEAAHATGR